MVDPDDLPLSTSALVLGASMSVPQRQHHYEMRGEKYSMAEVPVRIEGAGGGVYLKQRDRRYIAAWARRNLFEGAQPR